jgi:alpha-N-arabinofuranosidase
MNSYAPLLVHVGRGAMQWPTDLIGYDAASSFGSPSYYVEKMFSENVGNEAMPVQVTPGDAAVPIEPTTRPTEKIFAVANKIDASGDIVLKVVNTLPDAQTMQIDLQGAGDVKKDGTAWVLSGGPSDVNTIDEPEKVTPKQVEIHDAAATFAHEFPGYSVSVVRLKTK